MALQVSDNHSSILLIVSGKRLDIVEYLIQLGAPVNEQDEVSERDARIEWLTPISVLLTKCCLCSSLGGPRFTLQVGTSGPMIPWRQYQ